jgi:hypothetical protein
MPTFGYRQLYANGLNSNTQIRRATDMVYQRGSTYDVVLTGDTYYSSMELDVDIYVDDVKRGRQQVVPYDISESGGVYTYIFNVRPYDYIQNFIQSQHYPYYFKNDWNETSTFINDNNPYPNIVKANLKYGYRYLIGNTAITEYNDEPTRDFNHYTDIPNCPGSTGFTASDFTNTGPYFNFVGGIFQMFEKYYYPNQDQELGSVIGTGVTINTVDTYRRLSPMTQFLMDYPTLPEKSETSRFLTEAPRIQTVNVNDNFNLFYLAGQTGDRQVIEADFAVFEFYDINNNQIYYFEQDLYNEYPTGYTNSLNIKVLPCGPKDITDIFSEPVIGDPLYPIVYYTVQLFSAYDYDYLFRHADLGPIVPVSERIYLYTSGTPSSIRRSCGPENTRLTWLNERGGYDYYTFTSYRQDKKKIERQTYDSRYYAPDQTADHDYGRSVKEFSSVVDQEVILETDFINVEEGNWLEGLFLSPQVYEMKDSFISPLDQQDKIYMDLRPLQVISTEVETISKKHKKLNKYRITFKRANTFFTSKGF